MIQTIHIRCACGHQAPAEEFIQASDRLWHCRNCGTAFRAANPSERDDPEYVSVLTEWGSEHGMIVKKQMELTI